MSESEEKQSRMKKLLGLPKKAWQSTGAGLGRGRMRVRNWRRRKKQIDYVSMTLRGSLPELSAPPRSFIQRQLPFPPPPLSLQAVNSRVQQIIDADNVRGVIFHLDGLQVGLATLQSLRQTIGRLRNAGKTVVVYTPILSNGLYYLATAADKIIVPQSTNFDVYGLYSDVTFLKDALANWGITFTNLQISPYKSAFNNFSESDITPEQQEQIDWLMDDQYDILTSGMAEGRGKTTAELQAIIDSAPHTASQMLELGLVDHVAYDDELPHLLHNPTWEEEKEKKGKRKGKKEKKEGKKWRFSRQSKQLEEVASQSAEVEIESDGEKATAKPKATILSWSEATKKLQGKYRRRVRGKKIAIITMKGAITLGDSQTSPFGLPLPIIGSQTAGSRTFIQQMRQAEEDDQIAALVLHVDSPGGMAIAADLMNRELIRWRQHKPLVVYMSNAAASGGYYVSTFAHHIVAQTGTITGSIGVTAGRFNTEELYQHLKIGRGSFQRGARAHLFNGDTTLSDDEVTVLMNGIRHSYHQFKTLVADGRGIPYEELDEICLGKVWTGRQALNHKLVDSHGDLRDALRKATELAGLPTDDDHLVVVEKIDIEDGSNTPLPKPFGEEAAAWLSQVTADNLQQWQNQPLYLLPFTMKTRS